MFLEGRKIMSKRQSIKFLSQKLWEYFYSLRKDPFIFRFSDEMADRLGVSIYRTKKCLKLLVDENLIEAKPVWSEGRGYYQKGYLIKILGDVK